MAEFLEAAHRWGHQLRLVLQRRLRRSSSAPPRRRSEHRKLVHPYPVRRFRLILRETLAGAWSDVLNLYHRAYGRYAGFRAQAFDDFTTSRQTAARRRRKTTRC
jgi:hypothetical protein